MATFGTFVLKVASRCNLDCEYCYIYHGGDETWKHQPKFMSPEIARISASRIAAYANARALSQAPIVLHGGEPLLGGVSRIRDWVKAIEDGFRDSTARPRIGMQTNGLLLTPELAQELAELNVNVWLSGDGPGQSNGRRVDRRGRASTSRLQKAFVIAQQHLKTAFGGILVVVDPNSDVEELWDWAEEIDPPMIDFLLPLVTHDHAGSELNDKYGIWLSSAYEAWLSRPSSPRVRLFEQIASRLVAGDDDVGTTWLASLHTCVIEADGGYHLDDTFRIVENGFTDLGKNVHDVKLEDLEIVARRLTLELQIATLPTPCIECSFVHVCGGGLPLHRYSKESQFDRPSALCSSMTSIINTIGLSMTAALRNSCSTV